VTRPSLKGEECNMIVNKFSDLTDCEIYTMKIIWAASEAITCSEIIERLNTKYHLVYKDTTVYTFVKNLKEKGYVDSFKKGVLFYTPKIPEEEFLKKYMEKVTEVLFDNNVASCLEIMARPTVEELEAAVPLGEHPGPYAQGFHDALDELKHYGGRNIEYITVDSKGRKASGK